MARATSAWIGLLCLAWATAAVAQETAADDIAVAVRDAGHACTNPDDARADPDRSSPDEAAWTIHCDEGAYSVRFKGDTGAAVEKLGG